MENKIVVTFESKDELAKLLGFADWDEVVDSLGNDATPQSAVQSLHVPWKDGTPPKIEERPESVVVRFWEETEDGDASAEGILTRNDEYDAGGGPEYQGNVTDVRTGKSTYTTIN